MMEIVEKYSILITFPLHFGVVSLYHFGKSEFNLYS